MGEITSIKVTGQYQLEDTDMPHDQVLTMGVNVPHQCLKSLCGLLCFPPFPSSPPLQIEAAVSKTVFEQEKKLREAGYAMHQSMRGISKDRMKWGFKITYKPLEAKVSR